MTRLCLFFLQLPWLTVAILELRAGYHWLEWLFFFPYSVFNIVLLCTIYYPMSFPFFGCPLSSTSPISRTDRVFSLLFQFSSIMLSLYFLLFSYQCLSVSPYFFFLLLLSIHIILHDRSIPFLLYFVVCGMRWWWWQGVLGMFSEDFMKFKIVEIQDSRYI